MAVKIAFANQKGGCGKTTSAIMTAQNLSALGKKVLVIDTDPQSNTTHFYQAVTDGVGTFADIMYDKDADAAECIQHTDRGDIIPCEMQLRDADTMVRMDDFRSLHLKMAAKKLDALYDYIIIDTPPSAGVILRNVLAYADHVVIPCAESGWSLSGLMDFYADTILQAQAVTNPSLKVAGILIVLSRPRTKEAARIREFAKQLAEKMQTGVFDTSIRTSVKVTEALTEYAVPLHEYAPGCNVDEDYQTFTQELISKTVR